MQFILDLIVAGRAEKFLSLHYHYGISAAITQILDKAEPDDRWLLLNAGPDCGDQVFKPFTYGELKFDAPTDGPRHTGSVHTRRHATLDIRFVGDHITEELIHRVFMNKWIDLGEPSAQIGCQIAGVKAVNPIVFDAEMTYRSVTPIYLNTFASDSFCFDGCSFHKLIKEGLLKRLLSFQPDFPVLKNKLHQYCPDIQFKLLNEPKKTTVTIQRSSEKPIQLMGHYFDFKLRASPVLHELGYYGGFGSKNWLGLGCVEVMA